MIKRSSAFTLMELLIVITLLVLLGLAVLVLMNPKKQLEKAWDGKRKTELSTLRKVLEDWYNDKNCYPRPVEICYANTDELSCQICGNEPNSPNFTPYLPDLPCDTQHPIRDYLYQVDNLVCPSWYKIYTQLSDAVSGSYNYGVSSENVPLAPYPTASITPPTGQPTSTPSAPTATPTPSTTPLPTGSPIPSQPTTPTPSFTPPTTPSPTPACQPPQMYCIKGAICNICSLFENCSGPGNCNVPLIIYQDSSCINQCYP